MKPRTRAEALERIEALIHSFNHQNYLQAARLGFAADDGAGNVLLKTDADPADAFIQGYLTRRHQLAVDILDMLG